MGSFILLFNLWNHTMLCSSFCSFCCSTLWSCVCITAWNCFFILIAVYYSIVLTFHKVLIYCHGDGHFLFGTIISATILHILEHRELSVGICIPVVSVFTQELKCWVRMCVFSKIPFQRGYTIQFTFPPAIYENSNFTPSLTLLFFI